MLVEFPFVFLGLIALGVITWLLVSMTFGKKIGGTVLDTKKEINQQIKLGQNKLVKYKTGMKIKFHDTKDSEDIGIIISESRDGDEMFLVASDYCSKNEGLTMWIKSTDIICEIDEE